MKYIQLIVLFFLPILLTAQTPYPLSFYWKGKITGQSAFEMRVNMYDSDRLLQGQGSRIKGECIFLDDYRTYTVEGSISNDKISLNCIDDKGEMQHSFIFENADGRKQRQLGKWTNGKINAEAYLDSKSDSDFPKNQQLGFSVGINVRRNQLEKDSLVSALLKTIPKIPFLPIGEGYRLDKLSFLRSDYYGTDYLEFSDTIVTKDSSLQISKLAWQLLHSKNGPYLLEIKNSRCTGKKSVLDLSVYHFQAGNWVNIDSLAIPISYTLEQLGFHKNFERIFIGNSSLYLFRKDQTKPIIWIWKEDKYIEQ